MRIPTRAQRLRISTRYKQHCGSTCRFPSNRLDARQHSTTPYATCRPGGLSLWKVSRLFVGGAENLERDRHGIARSLLVPTVCTRALAAPMLSMHVNLSARHLRNGLPRVHALQVRCRASVSCSRTPPFRVLHQLTPNGPAGRGEQLCITGQDLSSVLVETSVYAPSGLL